MMAGSMIMEPVRRSARKLLRPRPDDAHVRPQEEDEDDGLALACMDIFAGCGGLSEGFHQVGRAARQAGDGRQHSRRADPV